MFPLIWSNSHLNSDNPYSRRSRPSEHAWRWKQKSRLSKQYINVTGFRPLLFHWEAMNSKHGKRHSRHESWDVRKKQTEKSLTWPLPHKLWPNHSEAIKSSTIYWEPAILKLVSLISESNIIKVLKKLQSQFLSDSDPLKIKQAKMEKGNALLWNGANILWTMTQCFVLFSFHVFGWPMRAQNYYHSF